MPSITHTVPMTDTQGAEKVLTDVEEKTPSTDQVVAVTPEDDARVRRKIDKTILPLASAVYFMQYLDKRGLAFAAIFGLREDLNLQGQDYS